MPLCGSRSHPGRISIPPFSPGNVKIIPAIYFASIGISDLAFGSRSDQRYGPTLRTFLRIKLIFIRVGSPGSGCTCRPNMVRFSLQNFPRKFPAKLRTATVILHNRGTTSGRCAGPLATAASLQNPKVIFAVQGLTRR